MAHRSIAAALGLAGLVILPDRPLVSLVLFGAGIAVFANGRGAFGSGMSRAVLAFITALFLGLLGVVTSLLGMVPTEGGGNVLLVPGLLMLGLALTLLGWAIATLVRIRRQGRFWADG